MASTASEDKGFECSICLEAASDPVVTTCGHLFCWPCLYQWMQQHGHSHAPCPVCKSDIDRSKIIPMYSRGANREQSKHSFDTGEIPRRPDAPASSSSSTSSSSSAHGATHGSFRGMQGSTYGNNYFQAGVGFGPFFSFQLGNHHNGMGPARPLTPEEETQQRLSQVMAFIGLFIMLMLMMY